MNRLTQIFVASISVAAAVLLVLFALHLRISDPARFSAYALTALLASTFRVRIPALNGTYSLSFLVLLAAVYELQLGELLIIALVSAVVQSYWNAAARPLAIQVAFNVSNLTLSVAGAYGLYALHLWSADWIFLSGGLAALGFYVLNTGLTSMVLSLVKGGSLGQVWSHWNLYTLPYYLLGSSFPAPGYFAAARSTGKA